MGMQLGLGVKIGGKKNDPIYENILNIFSTAPTNNQFQDLSGYGNHFPIGNMQSACFPVTNPVTASVPSINFSGVSSLTFRTYLVWRTNLNYYPISFNGYSAAANGFAAKFGADGFLVLFLSNGTSNTTKTMAYSSWATAGSLVFMEITFNLNGNTTVSINGVQKYSSIVSIGGSFLTPTSRLINYAVATVDVHVAYSELVGYFKFHYKESSGNVVYDTSGNGRNLTVTANAINWNSFYGNHAAEYANGFSLHNGVVVLSLDDKTLDCQGNVIQYPAGSGIISILGMTYTIPTDADLNTKLEAGAHNWAWFEALVESKYIKITKTSTAISSLVVKKKMSSYLFHTLSLTQRISLTKRISL